MDKHKLETLIEYISSALESLQELHAQACNEESHQLALEPSATTAEVYMRLKHQYSWAGLKKWCDARNYQPAKIDQYGLAVNKYPASAWREVYGLDIVEALKLDN